MRFRNSFLFCCLLLVNHFTSQAQYLQKPVRVLTTKDGLPQSFISGLVQDKDGFVWIGTRNGLVRYDGIRFKLFQHSSRDTASLYSNLIISLQQDKHNRIWIEHESSNLDCFDPVTETIDHITARPLFRQHPVLMVRQGWLAEAGGNVWCVQKAAGLYRYDWKQNRVTHFTRSSHHLPSDTIKGLLEDRQQIWIVSQRGISRFDATTGQFTHTLFPFAADFNNYENSNGQMVAVQERKNGEIMFGDRQRLIFFNLTSKAFRTIPLPVVPKTGIRWIQEGPDGYEYLEAEGIVYRYDDIHRLVPVGDVGLTSFRDIQSFLIDRSGFIWLGTNAAGIHQIDLSAPFFESHPTTVSFHYDVLKAETGVQLDHFSGWPITDKQFYATSYYFRSAYDAQQRLWMALRDKVGYYDAVQKNITMLPAVPGISNADKPSWGIRGISFDAKGTLWVIGDQGYACYFNALQQQWITFIAPAIMQQLNPEISLVDIVADQNKLWIASGTGEGLICVDMATKKMLQLSHKTRPDLLPTNLVLGMKQDPTRPNLLWIGTYEGLVCLDKKTLTSEVFLVEQGLPDNTIYAIEIDKAGYLWLSTNKGLCRFHPVTHAVRTFRTADGLPGDEFNRFHSLRLSDGRLAFGGTDGWALFDPTRIKDDHYQPTVAFTNLHINNVPINGATVKGSLPAPLNHLTELSLPYDQNTLTFEFAGLEFNQPSKIRYRYQLKGYNEDWIVTTNPLANYTKLPPSHYILQLNATNTTGQWSPHIRTLAVVIRPPFWRTWWAYGIYVLLIAGLIWAYIQYRLYEERLRQEVLLKEREAEQLKTVDELKTRFYSNITHEFRTPLTLILAPAQQLKPTLQTAAQHQRVEAIERNAYQMLNLINQLLDLSKVESGNLSLHETSGSISSLAEELLLSFHSDAERRGILVTLRDETGKAAYWFDVEKLTQIITNLLANAVKFTPAGGKVELAITTKKQEFENSPAGIRITVSDTGIGIPPEQVPLVFDRFYQVTTENPGGSKGSGIGLSLVKELVELQGGTIEVCSPGKANDWSTCFTVWLPYRKADTVATIIKTAQPKLPVVPLYLPQPVNFPENTPTENEEERESILLIEDNDELALFIAGSLPPQYAISRASNGAEGLEMAFAQIPDLIISDVVMPLMDGFECCRRLKTDERTNHIPVILLTAKAAFDSRITGLTQGADDYLTKPFHVQELQLRVHNLLQRQHRLREKWQAEWSRPQPGKPIPDASLHIQAVKEQLVTEQHTEAQSAKDEASPVEKPLNDLQEAFVQKLYAIVEEKLDETAFGVEGLATEIGMSRANLHRKLKALTGLPASDVVRNYRLQRASTFLKQGFNSSETAYKTGFDSPAYFTKCFRELYGTTPTEFAKMM